MKKKTISDWLKVRGQEFTRDEARQALDFSDTMSNFYVQPEDLKAFHAEGLKLGHRLFMAEMMPIDDIGVALFGEEDKRIISIATERRDGSLGGLYVPGSSSGIILK